MHPIGLEFQLGAEAGRAVLGVGDHCVHAPDEAPCGGELAGPRLARQNVVRREHARAARREQPHVERLDGEPLVVDEVRLRSLTPVAQHVRHVLRELERDPPATLEPAPRGPPVEVLGDAIAVSAWHRPVQEPAGDQLNVDTRARQRGRKRVVVRRRER